MNVNGAIFPRQVRMLSLALVADDLALQGSFEVALDLTIWPIGHTVLHDVRRDARCRRFFVRLLIVRAGESFRSWTFMIKNRPFISTSLSALWSSVKN